MTDAELLALVESAFGVTPRPAHFTNWQHCCECAEHDETLQARTVANLTLEDIGTPGAWSPISMMTSEAMQYYFPALVRLSLTKPVAESFLIETVELLRDPNGWQLELFSPAQCRAVQKFLSHVRRRYIREVSDYHPWAREMLDTVIGNWRMRLRAARRARARSN